MYLKKCVSLFAGSYFASHFIMGGEKFDSTHPEGYLFGENTDLNFLGTRPVAVGVLTHEQLFSKRPKLCRSGAFGPVTRSSTVDGDWPVDAHDLNF